MSTYEGTAKRAFAILVILFLAQLSLTGASQSLAVVAPLIEAELNLTKAQFGMFTSLFYIGAVIASLPSGSIVDNVGVKNVLFAGLIISGISILTFSFFSHYLLLLFLFFIAGLGYSTITPASTKAIVHWVPVKYRGTAMGFKQTGVTVGGAIAAATLPLVAMVYGWRGAIFLCGIILIIVSLSSFLIYLDKKDVKVTDININFKEGKTSWVNTWRAVWQNRPILIMSILGFILAFSQLSIITYSVMYYTEELKFEVVRSGQLLSITLVGATLGRLAWGTVSDRVFSGNRTIVLSLIAFIASSGLLGLSFVSPATSYYLIVFLAFIVGSTAIGWNALFLVTVGEMTDKEYVGTAIGFATMFVFFGSVVGTPIFGFLVDITEGFSLAYRIYSLMLCLVGLLFFIILGRGSTVYRENNS